MATTGEKASGGDPKNASGAGKDNDGSLGLISRLLCKRAVDLKGGLTPEAQIRADLREAPDRHKFLKQVVNELVPEGVSSGI